MQSVLYVVISRIRRTCPRTTNVSAYSKHCSNLLDISEESIIVQDDLTFFFRELFQDYPNQTIRTTATKASATTKQSTMDSAITMSNASDNKNFLNSRLKALRLRQLRQVRRLTSFRAPRECTAKLLHFHAEDDHSDDDPWICRRRALQRRDCHHQRRRSFCLPKEQTQFLLSKHFVEDLDQQELAAHTAEVTAGVTSLSVQTVPKCTHKTPLRRFGGARSIQRQRESTVTPTPRMASFRLPKEHTSKVLQHQHAAAWKQQNLQNGMDDNNTSNDDDSMPARPPLERRSSQTARTA